MVLPEVMEFLKTGSMPPAQLTYIDAGIGLIFLWIVVAMYILSECLKEGGPID